MTHKYKCLFSFLILFLLTGCGESTTNIQEPKVTIIKQTELVEITQIIKETVLVEVPVTVTPSPTPKNSPTPSFTPTITYTPTITPTPSQTATPTSTPNFAQTATVEAYGKLSQPKQDGFYTVGEEIITGKWESQGTGGNCYWAVYNENQDLIKNHFGYAGGTVNLLPSHYEVEFSGCGKWTYIEGAERDLLSSAEEDKKDGFYTIGVEIAIGKWQSQSTGDGCYWAILNDRQDIMKNHFGNAGGTVNLINTHYEVDFDGCGTWIYLGP